MCHAVEGQPLFRSDADFRRYLGLLQLSVERHAWSLRTFALMSNHVHLLAAAPPASVSDGLWYLNWRYALYYTQKYRPRFGHVFGARPKMKPIGDEAYYLAVTRYIALNPVGAMVERPEDYPWSAHRELIGESPRLPFLDRSEILGMFGDRDRVSKYLQFVTGAEPRRTGEVRRWAGEHRPRPSLDELGSQPTALLEAHDTWGYSLRVIAAATGRSLSTVYRMIDEARRRA